MSKRKFDINEMLNIIKNFGLNHFYLSSKGITNDYFFKISDNYKHYKSSMNEKQIKEVHSFLRSLANTLNDIYKLKGLEIYNQSKSKRIYNKTDIFFNVIGKLRRDIMVLKQLNDGVKLNYVKCEKSGQ